MQGKERRAQLKGLGFRVPRPPVQQEQACVSQGSSGSQAPNAKAQDEAIRKKPVSFSFGKPATEVPSILRAPFRREERVRELFNWPRNFDVRCVRKRSE